MDAFGFGINEGSPQFVLLSQLCRYRCWHDHRATWTSKDNWGTADATLCSAHSSPTRKHENNSRTIFRASGAAAGRVPLKLHLRVDSSLEGP